MRSSIDGSLYPDTDVPATLDSLAERVDFLVRLCGAWDFGVLPDRETISEIRRPDWRQAVDAAHLLTSPSYHLVRTWHSLPPLHISARSNRPALTNGIADELINGRLG